MKRKEITALHTKPRAELEKSLNEMRGRLRALTFDLAAGKVKNVSELHKLKKDIARVLTVLNAARPAGEKDGTEKSL